MFRWHLVTLSVSRSLFLFSLSLSLFKTVLFLPPSVSPTFQLTARTISISFHLSRPHTLPPFPLFSLCLCLSLSHALCIVHHNFIPSAPTFIVLFVCHDAILVQIIYTHAYQMDIHSHSRCKWAVTMFIPFQQIPSHIWAMVFSANYWVIGFGQWGRLRNFWIMTQNEKENYKPNQRSYVNEKLEETHRRVEKYSLATSWAYTLVHKMRNRFREGKKWQRKKKIWCGRQKGVEANVFGLNTISHSEKKIGHNIKLANASLRDVCTK